MSSSSSGAKAFTNNFLWRFFERCGAQGVTFIVSIILARLLEPEAYGLVALVSVFTVLLEVFVDSGFGNALIQKKNPDDLDYSTVFYFNITICGLLYAVMFFAAPFIAGAYHKPELTPVFRVMCLTVVIAGVKNIQHSYVAKNMLFKRFFFATLGGTIFAALLGIWMAYRGYGVWALVAQNLSNQLIDTIILWITVKWRPKRMFSFTRLKSLFSYGWKILCSSLLDTAYKELNQLIIGLKYTSSDLAFYNKGNSFPKTVIQNVNSSINSVLFPAMSAKQDQVEELKMMTRRAIKTSTYIIMPIMMGLAVCAEPFIRIVLTEKWLPCVPFMRVFCFTLAFYPLHTANLNAIKALGRSDYFLKLEIMKKIVGLSVLGVTMWFGAIWIAYGAVLSSILSQIINAYPNRKLLNYRYLDQLRDMLPQIALSCFMGTLVYCVQFLNLGDWLTIGIQVPLGVLIYVLVSKIFRIDSFSYVLDLAKSYLHREKKKS